MRLPLAIAAGSLLYAPCASAQEVEAVDPDLKCAAFVSLVAGMAPDEEVRSGLSLALGYFVGRYEAKAGKWTDEGFSRELSESVAENIAQVSNECRPLITSMVDRIGSVAESLMSADTADDVDAETE